MMTSRKRFHLGTAGRRIPGAVVLLLTALAFMPVFVGSPCGSIHSPQRLGLVYANHALKDFQDNRPRLMPGCLPFEAKNGCAANGAAKPAMHRLADPRPKLNR